MWIFVDRRLFLPEILTSIYHNTDNSNIQDRRDRAKSDVYDAKLGVVSDLGRNELGVYPRSSAMFVWLSLTFDPGWESPPASHGIYWPLLAGGLFPFDPSSSLPVIYLVYLLSSSLPHLPPSRLILPSPQLSPIYSLAIYHNHGILRGPARHGFRRFFSERFPRGRIYGCEPFGPVG